MSSNANTLPEPELLELLIQLQVNLNIQSKHRNGFIQL